MTTNKQTFAIVANVAFEIPKFLAGAFNTYHIGKGRLLKAGNIGRVTPEGVKFFTQREGQAPSAKTLKEFADTCSAAKFPITEKQGVQWPVGNNAIAWQAGQGAIGQSAFFYALCQLTSKPAPKAESKAVAKPKPTVKASAAKQAKPAKPVVTVKA